MDKDRVQNILKALKSIYKDAHTHRFVCFKYNIIRYFKHMNFVVLVRRYNPLYRRKKKDFSGVKFRGTYRIVTPLYGQ